MFYPFFQTIQCMNTLGIGSHKEVKRWVEDRPPIKLCHFESDERVYGHGPEIESQGIATMRATIRTITTTCRQTPKINPKRWHKSWASETI